MMLRWCYLVALLFLCGYSSVRGARIYLSSAIASATVWNGSCTTTACTAATPCLFSAGVFTNMDPVACLLYLAEEAGFGSFTFRNLGGEKTRVHVGDPTLGELSDGSLNFVISNALFLCDGYYEVNINITAAEAYEGTVTLGSSECGNMFGFDFLDDSPITLNDGIIALDCFVSHIYTGEVPPFTFATAPAPEHVVLSGTELTAYGSELFGGDYFNGATFENKAQVTLYSWLTTASSVNIPNGSKIRISDSGTQIKLLSNRWLRYTAPLDLIVENGGMLTGNTVTNPSLLGSLNAFTANFGILSRLTFTIAPTVQTFIISNSTFTDCRLLVRGDDALMFARTISDSIFTYSASAPINSSLVLSGTSGLEFELYNVTINGNSTTRSGAGALWFSPTSGNSGTTATSSIYTSRLILSENANYTLGNLAVTHTITRDNATRPTSPGPVFLLPHPTIASAWTFHSINVTGVDVDLSGTSQFVYRASSPLQGIQLLPPYSYDTSNSFSTPNKIIIDWAPTINPTTPNTGQFYPVAQFSSNSSEISFSGFSISEGQSLVHLYQGSSALNYVVVQLEPVDPLVAIPTATPTSSTPITPQTPIHNCPTPTPIGFECINGQLVANGDVTGPTIVIPPNSGTVQINGNLTTETIVLDGFGSTLNVSGCALIPGGITIQLKGKDKNLPEGPLVLVTQNDGCTSSLLDVPVHVDEEKSCKKTKVTQAESATKSSLVVLMNVDSSACKTRWIILGSVLGCLLIITAIVAVVWKVCFYNKTRGPQPRATA